MERGKWLIERIEWLARHSALSFFRFVYFLWLVSTGGRFPKLPSVIFSSAIWVTVCSFYLFVLFFSFSFFLWYILINWLITQLTSIAISHRIIESEGISTLILNFSSLSLFRSMPILPVVGTFLQLLVQTSAKCFDAGKQIFGYQYAPNTDDLAHITNQLVC